MPRGRCAACSSCSQLRCLILESIYKIKLEVPSKHTRLDERGLAHVRKKGKDRIKRGKVLLFTSTVLDTSEKLGKDGQVQDERGGQERILNNTKLVDRKR